MKLKVCGMKYDDNIRELAKLSPDYIGFNFYTRSKRYVGRNFDSKIAKGIPSRIQTVGIFVNSRGAYIMDKVKRFQLDYVQLHGNEAPGFCQRLNKSVKVIKAFGVDDNFNFKILEKYKAYCDYFLFDTKTKNYGGSGKAFNWAILKKYSDKVPFFISGGIDLKDLNKISNLKSQILSLYA